MHYPSSMLALLAAASLAVAAQQKPSWQDRLAAFQRDFAVARQAEAGQGERPDDKEWVKRRLASMVDFDQRIRNFWLEGFEEAGAAGQSDEFRVALNRAMSDVDRYDTAELKKLLAVYDWFTIDEFGERADRDGWLLVQHADLDPAFQKDVLARLENLYRAGRTSKKNYAYLYDRVAAGAGQPQRYGTQGMCEGSAWRPDAIEDPATVDERRASVGLEPLAAYRASMKCP